jgi:hypothetical protein
VSKVLRIAERQGSYGTENFTERVGAPRLVGTIARSAVRCRCGTRLPEGSRCFEFRSVPEPLVGLLEGEAFCGLPCVRSFLLEALETLESPGSSALVSDVREVFCSLQALLIVEENHRQSQEGGPPASPP